MRVLRVRFKVQRVMVALAVVVLAPAGGQAHGQADPGRPGDSLKARLAVVQARQSKAAERYARELRGATTDLARAAAEARYEREFRQDVGPLLSLARVNPDDPAAVRALQFVVTTDYLGSRGEAEQAIEILTRDHVRHRRSGNYCGVLTNLFYGFKLSDFRGKVVLLVFSGEWCRPCVEMYPRERALQVKYKGKPFAVLSVNTDESREALKRSIDAGKVTWPCWWDGGTDGPITTRWGVSGHPTVYVLDPRGIIRYKDVQGEALEKAVNELMANE